MAIVIIRNISGSDKFIEDLGINIGTSSDITLSEVFNIVEICTSDDLKTYIQNEDFVINDGIGWLSPTDGLAHVTLESEYADDVNEDVFYNYIYLPSDGYSYTHTLTVDHSQVSGSENFENFPVLVSLTEDWLKTVDNGGYVDSTSGYDIIFTDIDNNQYDHEIEYYDSTNGELVAWVKVPVLYANRETDIYMSYGNPDIYSSQENVTNVWDSNFKGVWHLNGVTSGGSSGTTDWKSPGTCANAARGSGADWQSPSNAQDSDNNRTICDIAANTYGDWLRCTNFGFTTDDIPTGATIIGIEVQIERQAENASYIRDDAIYLRDSGGQTGDNKADTGTNWPTSDATVTYGDSSDDWGTSISDSEVRASTFGIDISAFNTWFFFTPYEARIDHVQIRVHYSIQGTGTTEDSTTNNNDGTLTGTSEVTGQIGMAQDFTGSERDYIQVSGLMGSSQVLTLEGWANLDSKDTSGSRFIDIGNCVSITLDYSGTPEINAVYYDGSDWDQESNYVVTLAGGGWHYIAYTINTTTNVQKLYFDGDLVDEDNYTASVSYSGQGSNTYFGIHGDGSTTWDFDGKIDEVRISNTDRSEDWIKTCYNNQSSPSTFFGTSEDEEIEPAPGYSNYRQVFINNEYVEGSSDHTNFPILVNITKDYLKHIDYGGDVTSDFGYDIIFTDTDDNKLDHEVEDYDEVNGQIITWIRIPTLSYNEDTEIKLNFGNSEITESQENVSGVWDSNYIGVWHLHDDFNDSAGSNNATNYGSIDITGKIADGQSLVTNDYIDLPNGIFSSASNFTFSAWVYYDGGSAWTRIFDFGSSTTVYMFLTPYDGNNVSMTFAITTSGSGGEQEIDTGSLLSTGSWRYIAVTINGTTNNGYIYLDGEEAGSNESMTLDPTSLGSTTNNWLGRSQYGADPYLNGDLDEVRVLNTNRSIDWLKTEYNNQNSPSTFITVVEPSDPSQEGDPEVIQVYDSDGGTSINNSTPTAIPFGSETYKNTIVFTHSNFSNTSRITINEDGLYRIGYSISWYENDTSNAHIRARIRKNGSLFLTNGTDSYKAGDSDNREESICRAVVVERFIEDDYVEVLCDGVGGDTAEAYTEANASWFFIEKLQN